MRTSQTVAIIQGGDKINNLNSKGLQVIKHVDKFLGEPIINVAGVTRSVSVQAVLSADMAALGTINAAPGGNTRHPCPLCNVDTPNLFNVDKNLKFQIRDRIFQLELAHLTIGRCRGCKKEIVEVFNPALGHTTATHAQLARPGAEYSDSLYDRDEHYHCFWGVAPLFENIDCGNPACVCFDIMHLHMRITAAFLKKLILAKIKASNAKEPKAMSNQAKAVFDMFKTLKIPVTQHYFPKSTTADFYTSIKVASLQMRDCRKILESFELLAHLVYKPEDLTRARALEAVAHYRDKVWPVIYSADLPENLPAKGDLVEELGLELSRLFILACGANSKFVYFHVLARHLPMSYRSLKLDPFFFCCQAAERSHQALKKDIKISSRVSPSSPRAQSTFAQLLSHSLMRRMCLEILHDTEHSQELEVITSKLQKMARDEKLKEVKSEADIKVLIKDLQDKRAQDLLLQEELVVEEKERVKRLRKKAPSRRIAADAEQF